MISNFLSVVQSINEYPRGLLIVRTRVAYSRALMDRFTPPLCAHGAIRPQAGRRWPENGRMWPIAGRLVDGGKSRLLYHSKEMIAS